jgi:hypothetical protein
MVSSYLTTSDDSSTSLRFVCSTHHHELKEVLEDHAEELVTTSSTIQPKAKVSFAQTCKVVLGPSLDDYTAQEISAAWYNGNDYSVIHRKCGSLIRKIKNGKVDKYCVRGLERMTPRAIEERELTRIATYIAVLGEQNKPSYMRGDKSEAIARKYRQAAGVEKCQQVAHKVGLKDASFSAAYRNGC